MKLPDHLRLPEQSLGGIGTAAFADGAHGHLSDRAKAYGFPGVSLDGNNVLEVYDAAQKAIGRARADRAPRCSSARHIVGTGTRKSIRRKYRAKEEVDAWKKKDPVATLRSN